MTAASNSGGAAHAGNSTTPSSAESRSLPNTRAMLLLFVGILALTFTHAFMRTKAVRFGNSDDVAFQAIADAHTDEPYLVDAAQDQGRFYFATPVYRYLLLSPYRLDAVPFALFRTILLLMEAGLVGWLFGRVLYDPRLGAAVVLLIVGSLHFTRTFYPVLSYPPMAIGFISVLAAMHCQLTRVRGGGGWSGIAAVMLFLFACTCLEAFVVTLPVFFVLSYAQPGRRLADPLRDTVGMAIAAAGFVFTYFYFAHLYPSAYPGTRLSLQLVPAMRILVRQMVGAMPGFELIANRTLTGPILLPLNNVGSRLLETPFLDVGLAIVQALTVAALIASPRPSAARFSAVIAAITIAVALNLPIAFSEKYQVFIFHREYPYIYGFYSFCFIIAGSLVFVTWMRARWPGARRWVFAAIAGAVFTICLSAKASNHAILRELQREFPSAARHAPTPNRPDQ